jgi:hypothetical protein
MLKSLITTRKVQHCEKLKKSFFSYWKNASKNLNHISCDICWQIIVRIITGAGEILSKGKMKTTFLLFHFELENRNRLFPPFSFPTKKRLYFAFVLLCMLKSGQLVRLQKKKLLKETRAWLS